MVAKPGNDLHNFPNRFQGFTATQHSSIVDENYITVGAGVDPGLRNRIQKVSISISLDFCQRQTELFWWNKDGTSK